jgi:hypothetical protein
MPPREEHWTIDKKIPIAFLVGLFVQGAGIVWYFAKLDARQTSLEERIDVTDADQDRLANVLTAVIDRTTRLEVDYLSSKTDVSRRLENIEGKLDRMLEALPPRRTNAPGVPAMPYQRRAEDVQ